jgi:septum formation protein
MPLWLARHPLVLASKSDIRGKILAAAGLRFEIRPAHIDERALEAKSAVTDAKAVAALLARAKAQAIANAMPDYPVLGADQTLAFEGERFSKPANRAAAAEQIRRLRGKTHALHSAVSLMRNNEVLFECVEIAQLKMREVSDAFIEDYLDMAGEAALASVGAYQLEGIGIHLFESVDGDYFTILGLPLMPLLAYLRGNGFVDG